MKSALLLALLFCAASCGNPSRPASGAGTEDTTSRERLRIEFSEARFASPDADTVDFGRIREGESVRYEMLLHNATPDPVLILTVNTSCGCTSVDFPKQPILPGAEAPLSFTFDSKGFRGFQLKSLTLTTSADQRPLKIIITGEVI